MNMCVCLTKHGVNLLLLGFVNEVFNVEPVFLGALSAGAPC